MILFHHTKFQEKNMDSFFCPRTSLNTKQWTRTQEVWWCSCWMIAAKLLSFYIQQDAQWAYTRALLRGKTKVRVLLVFTWRRGGHVGSRQQSIHCTKHSLYFKSPGIDCKPAIRWIMQTSLEGNTVNNSTGSYNGWVLYQFLTLYTSISYFYSFPKVFIYSREHTYDC